MSKTTETAIDLNALEFGFLQLMDEYFPGTPMSGLNAAQRDALRRIAEKMGGNTDKFLTVMVRNWLSGVAGAVKRADEDMEWRIPVPSLSAVARHFDGVLSWMNVAGYAMTPETVSGKARRVHEAVSATIAA
jgi:hypothetical protein